MPPKLDPREVRRLLQRLPPAEARESLWSTIRSELQRVEKGEGRPAIPQPEKSRRPPVLLRAVRSRGVAAAAVLVVLIGGAYLGLRRGYDAPSGWGVTPLAGAPTVEGAPLSRPSEIEAGQWLVTDSLSRAELAVGQIGRVRLGPNTRLRLDRARPTEHRLTLDRGALDAVIVAPPRLFFVETPAVLATDLGCAYTLEVDSAGATRIHVTAGWVELSGDNGISLVPAGLVAEVEPGGRPGTPYPERLRAGARRALRRLDGGVGREEDLAVVLEALRSPSDAIAPRERSAITLWHLLQRLGGEFRVRVYERLAEISPPPPGVTREGILALDGPMLDRWRGELDLGWVWEGKKRAAGSPLQSKRPPPP